jgi:uncharacterized protein YeaO (DUF488 family)
MSIKTKCIYEPVEPDDGCRILVMRFWPRGISKGKIDLWEKELGTPAELIKKWKNGSISWKQFSKQYLDSVSDKDDIVAKIAKIAKKQTVTLLCSCKDSEKCHRILLKRLLMQHK